MRDINVVGLNVQILVLQAFILRMIVIGVESRAGKSKEQKMKKPKMSKKLAGWMFNVLYWLDMERLSEKKWKDELKRRYIKGGMSKKFPKGTFKKTWRFIEKAGLVREGCRAKQVRRRRQAE